MLRHRSRRKKYTPVNHTFALKPEDAASFAMRYPTGKHVFFGVVPRREQGRTKEAASLLHLCAWLDLDLDPEIALRRITNVLLPPTIVVASGQHIQAYWVYREPVHAEVNEQLVKKLLEFCGGDTSTTNPNRLMRVPGSQHVKDPQRPRPCTILTIDPQRLFIAEDLEAALRLNFSARNKIIAGSGAAYDGKQSDLDFMATMALMRRGMSDDGIVGILKNTALGISDAVLRKTDHYLETTLAAARSQFAADQIRVPKTFEEREDGLYMAGMRVATFTYTPHMLIEDREEGDLLVGTLRSGSLRWDNYEMPRTAFNSRAALSSALTPMACAWTGTDTQVRGFLPWLFAKSQASGLSTVTSVRRTGLHGGYYLSGNQILNRDGLVSQDECPYYPRKLSNLVETAWVEPDIPLPPLLQTITEVLPQINHPHVVYPILGWFLATPMKIPLKEIGIKFPSLLCWGSRGSGKTTTIEAVFNRLIGKPKDTGASIELSKEWDRISRISCNGIPVYFTEYRHASPNTRQFESLLRELYDESTAGRGRKDLSVVRYALNAPIVLTGEELTDDAASIERSIVVHFSDDQFIAPGSQAYGAMHTLIDLPLEMFALPYLTFVLRLLEDETAIRTLWLKAEALCIQAFDRNKLPDRMFLSIVVATVGLLSYSLFLSSHGILFEINVPLLVSAFQPALTEMLSENGRTETPVERFVEDVIHAAFAYEIGGRREPPFLYRILTPEKGPDRDAVFWFNLPGAYDWWREKRLKNREDIVSRKVILAQLKERRQEYTVPPTTISIDSQFRQHHADTPATASMHGIRLAQAAAVMDLPKWHALSSSNGHGKYVTERNVR